MARDLASPRQSQNRGSKDFDAPDNVSRHQRPSRGSKQLNLSHSHENCPPKCAEIHDSYTEIQGNSSISFSPSDLASAPNNNLPMDETEPPEIGHSQPHTTILDLQSDSATSSALPENFGFTISRDGKLVAVYGSKNVWLVYTEQLPRAFMRIFEVRRKPVAIDVLDDGSLLAVLTNSTKLDIYSLTDGDNTTVKRKKTVYLTHESTCLSLAPNGTVLAVGSRHGIEIISLVAADSEPDKRVMTSEPMDSLYFSDDSRTIIATTIARHRKSTTIFTVHGSFDGPFTEEGEPILMEVDKAWTSQVLFPEKAKRARQATLLPDANTAQINELFAYDADHHTWGIYDVISAAFKESKKFLPDVPRSTRSGLVEAAMPAVSPLADHVAIAVKQERCAEIWLYRLPESQGGDLEYNEDINHARDDSPTEPCLKVRLPRDEESRSQEIATLRWLKIPGPAEAERLIAVGSNVAASSPDGSMGDIAQSSSGVIVIVDFDRDTSVGPIEAVPKRIVFDLDSLMPGERLPDEDIDFEREVEIVRRRTVAQRAANERAAARRMSRQLGRSSTTASRDSDRRNSNVPTISLEEDTLRGDEVHAAFEQPYDHSQPRSQASLTRAATVAATAPNSRTRLRALPDRPLEYRRADGLREIPHESDADNWVPPPPPYTPRADPPGPNAVSISLSHPDNREQPSNAAPNPLPAPPPMQSTPIQTSRTFPSVPTLSVPRPRNSRRPQTQDQEFSMQGAPPVPPLPTNLSDRSPQPQTVRSQSRRSSTTPLPTVPPVRIPTIPPSMITPPTNVVAPIPVRVIRRPVGDEVLGPPQPAPASVSNLTVEQTIRTPVPPITLPPIPSNPRALPRSRPLIPSGAPGFESLNPGTMPVPSGHPPPHHMRPRPLPNQSYPRPTSMASSQQSAYMETASSVPRRPVGRRSGHSRSSTEHRNSISSSFYMGGRRAASSEALHIQPRSVSAMDSHRDPYGGSAPQQQQQQQQQQPGRRPFLSRLNTVDSTHRGSQHLAPGHSRQPMASAPPFANPDPWGERRHQPVTTPVRRDEKMVRVKCVVM